MRKIIIFAIIFLFTALTEVFPSTIGREEARARVYLERARVLYDRSQYDSLPYYYGFAAEVFNRYGDYKRTAECLLGMVDYHRAMDHQEEAANLLDSAESYILSNFGKNSESWADALYTRAKLYTSKNLEREAIFLLNDCLALCKKLELPEDKIARIQNTMGIAYFYLGDLQNAEECYLAALQEYSDITQAPSVEKGILLFNLGLIYSRRREFQKWLECLRQGIGNNILLFGPDFPDLADNYNSLSSYYIQNGQLDSARHYLDRAESIVIRAFGRDYYDLSRIYINRARIYRYLGNYHEALEYYLQALRIVEGQEIPSQSLTEIICINLGNLYSATGEYDTALQYLLRLLSAEGKVHPGRMAKYYIQLAELYLKMSRFDMAGQYLEQASRIRDTNQESGRAERLYEYMLEGILMDSIKHWEEAEKYHGMALEIAQEKFGEYHYWTARAYKDLGDHYSGTGDYRLALNHYQKALHSIDSAYDMNAVETNPDPGDITDLLFYLQVLKEKADVLEKMRDKVPAFYAYLTSVEVTEMLRNSYLTDESKLYLSENERRTYEEGVKDAFQCYELTSENNYLEEAFRITEKSKYATLQSILHREKAFDLSGIPDSVRRKESDLQRQLAVYRALINERREEPLPDQVQLTQYKEEIFHLNDQIAGLHRSLERHYPNYYDLLLAPKVMDLHVLRRKLGRKDKLIEYFITGSDLYIFELSRNILRCTRHTADSLWLGDLKLVMDFMRPGSPGDSIQDEHLAFIESAGRLYKSLVPFQPDLKNLIIIPDGKLSYLPFDVLITEPVPDFSGLYRDLPFLVRDHTIRYGYSASLLYRPDRRIPGNLKRFVGFAPGYMDRQGTRNDLQNEREIIIDRQKLDPLPGSIDEVTEIGRMFGGKVFTGKNATESSFKENAGGSHVIHLATHAFLDDEDPLYSTLVFSREQRGGEDDLLKVYELYNMDLNARMVVLNACKSGAGKMMGGEGIMSLARAFYYAGVPSIVMTLWTVTDQQGYKLILSFYNQLRKGRRAETALQKAKLEYLDSALPGNQHPRYWAGFIYMGKSEYFIPSWKPLALSGIVVGMVLILLWVRNLLKKSRDPGT